MRSVLERYQSLSERERDVMRRMVAGEASKVIAIDLGLSLKTVELHRRSVMQKMHVDSIPALVEAALALERAPGA
jgi:two-component system, LuxR family, response regulator FixJ